MDKREQAISHAVRGEQLAAGGKLDEAVSAFREAASIDPQIAGIHHNLGLLLRRQGLTGEAMECYRRAIALEPDYVDAYYNLGNALFESGQPEDAARSFQKAVHLKPDFVEAHFNLGNALKGQGAFEEAALSFQKAVDLRPEYAFAHYNLGHVFQELGRLIEAAASYRKALAILPDDAEIHYSLGVALIGQGDFEAALDCYRRALGIDANHAQAHAGMGNALRKLGRGEEALGHFQTAIALKPDFEDALNRLGNAYLEMGEADEARTCFRRMIELGAGSYGGNLRAAIKSLMCFPAIDKSTDEIDRLRRELADGLKTVGLNGETLENPVWDIGLTNFLLAYHDRNDRSLQQGIAEMYLRVCPSLDWTPGQVSRQRNASDKIRVGALSAFFHNHTIGKLNRGWIEHLDRDRFEVVVFRLPGEPDKLSTLIDAAADQVVVLQKDLDTDRARIAAEDLDILFYPEIGMDPFTYFLAFSRLAPMQAVTWGHPDTTGIPNIDYFLSAEGLETPESDDHYSETLIRLKHLPVFYSSPPALAALPGRDHFGLPQGARLYVIAQTLFKFHPSFDAVLGRLLKADPDGRLILISGNNPHWDGLLRERFEAAFPEEAGRVVFLPRMDGADYMALLGSADALLDTPHFGGGNSSYEAFSAGIPIVAWPTNFLRGRITCAQYQVMGILDLIAQDAESYVDLALRLAQDMPFREEMKKRIKDNSHKLFENHEAVRALERFFQDAVDGTLSPR